MKKITRLLLLLFLFPALSIAQSLDFETLALPGYMPSGWSASPADGVFADKNIRRTGEYSLFMDGSKAVRVYAYTKGNLLYAGDTICLKGFIRAERLAGHAKIIFSLSGDVQDEGSHIISGCFIAGADTGDNWREFVLKLPLCEQVKYFKIFCLINGDGLVWLDDFELSIDGKPLDKAPEKPDQMFDYQAGHDTRFDKGSGFTPTLPFTPEQIENLNVLCRVWGLLKYYHPQVAAGNYNWDYELLDVLPQVYDLTPEKRNRFLAGWIEKTGRFEVHRSVPGENQSTAQNSIRWVEDSRRFGRQLSAQLTALTQAERPPFHYYYHAEDISNIPYFDHELSYADMDFSDVGFRLLGVFRLWNVIEFFYPYREITADRDSLLSEVIHYMSTPDINDKGDYLLVVSRLLCGLHDSHGHIIDPDRALGKKLFTHVAPFVTGDFVEGKFLVKAVFDGPGKENLMKRDAITHIDGKSAYEFIDGYKHILPASNYHKLCQKVSHSQPFLTNKEEVVYTVDRNGEQVDVRVRTYPLEEGRQVISQYQPDRKTAYRILEDSIAYINLDVISVKDLESIHKAYFAYPKLIIDNRGGCEDEGEGYVFDLLTELLPGTFPVVRFTHFDLMRPGYFIETPGRYDYYTGYNKRKQNIVLLVNSETQSYNEYISMMLQNIPGLVTVGTQTAGADGNVIYLDLPGNIQAVFTGANMSYPDGTPCQGVGVRVDEIVHPTLKAVRAGRDEVLEKAVKILGAACK